MAAVPAIKTLAIGNTLCHHLPSFITPIIEGPTAMTGRRRIEDRILKKEQEIQELEMKIREARAYVQALQDVAKMLPREADSDKEPGTALRSGSAVGDARQAILKAGRPLHIVEILKATGREVNRQNRTGVSGSLAAYVRRREIFTRSRPNTFGLIELESAARQEQPRQDRPAGAEPPEDFGLDENENA